MRHNDSGINKWKTCNYGFFFLFYFVILTDCNIYLVNSDLGGLSVLAGAKEGRAFLVSAEELTATEAAAL